MAIKKESKLIAKSTKVKEVKKVKPSFPTKKYPLIKDVSIGGVLFKKGTNYPLTEQGRQYFKQQFYIK
jgi:hypothetical protein